MAAALHSFAPHHEEEEAEKKKKKKEESALQCGTTSHTYLPISIPCIHVHSLHNAELLVFLRFLLMAENLHDSV